MAKSAYDRWLRFMARPTSVSGITFPKDEAAAIMALPPTDADLDWRRQKRNINKAARRARRLRFHSRNE